MQAPTLSDVETVRKALTRLADEFRTLAITAADLSGGSYSAGDVDLGGKQAYEANTWRAAALRVSTLAADVTGALLDDADAEAAAWQPPTFTPAPPAVEEVGPFRNLAPTSPDGPWPADYNRNPAPGMFCDDPACDCGGAPTGKPSLDDEDALIRAAVYAFDRVEADHAADVIRLASIVVLNATLRTIARRANQDPALRRILDGITL